MIAASIIFITGLLASAFFSGTETGLYRVPRVRLVLDGVAGSWTAKFLLWLTNHPAAFVSTVLVGNNIANYLASFGIVLFAGSLIGHSSTTFELALTLLVTPVLFIYGELLPKSLFYNAPFRLLSLCGSMLFTVSVLLSPISLMLYGASLAVQRFSGQTPLKVFPALARRELKRMLTESSQMGLLTATQQNISQNILAYGGTTIRQYCMPVRGLKTIPSDAELSELQMLATKHKSEIIAVKHPRYDRLVGYYRIADMLSLVDAAPKLRALLTLSPETSQAVALSQMMSHQCDLARVIDSHGDLVGVVLRQRLLNQMLQQE